MRILCDRKRALPVARAEAPVAHRASLAVASPNGKPASRLNGDVATAVRREHVLRGRPVRFAHDALDLHRTGRVRNAIECAQLATCLEHRPPHRDPAIAHATHGTAMREVQRVRSHDLAVHAAVAFDAPLERTPCTIHLVARGMRVVVHLFAVVVHHVGTRVGERPRDITVEADHHRGRTRDGDSVDVEPPGHHDMRLVPDRGQREIEVRIARKQRVTTRRATGPHRPVVAGHRARRIVRVFPRLLAGRHEDIRRGEHQRSGRIGRSGWCKRMEIHPRCRLPIRLDGFLDWRVVGKQGFRCPRAHARCRRRAIVFHGEVRERVSHAIEQVIRIDRGPHRRTRASEPEFQRQLRGGHLPHIRIHAVRIRGHQLHEGRRVASRGERTFRRARQP